ncbi:MAG: trimethylamine methyltransferase family protein, partial [Pseudomonadota bacterium]
MGEDIAPTRRGGRRRRSDKPERVVDYRRLRHPFSPQTVFTEEEVVRLHDTALRVLEELGIRILLPEARALFAAAGARVEEEMVFIGRDIVAWALETAPTSVMLRAPNPAREQVYAEGSLIFAPGGGCPNATDRVRGRRPGSIADFEEVIKLTQSFDVVHVLGPSVEPQDVPVAVRHYATTRAQVGLSDKPVSIYARGRGQVEDCFAMIRLAHGLSEDQFTDGAWVKTVINSNSPRMIDRPMAEGLIDFARAGQLTIVTPFCLAGAMAPVTVAGALTLQHAEALAGITLAQLARAGAPVSYGGFSSNVDMRSGAPAFGTPEHLKMQMGAGQLARHIGLPWRSAAGAASNTADMQAATETDMGLWGAMMANATMTLHAAGWLEGGLSFGYEKFINDVEALQTLAELCAPVSGEADEIGFDALAEVAPGGHFFATAHTMARYDTAFYAPLVADLSNHGSWEEAGSQTAAERATAIWQRTLADFSPPPGAEAAAARIDDFIARRKAEGGAP